MLLSDPLVAIIAGGDTAERESSITSGYNVFDALRSRFACILLELHNGEWSVLAQETRGLLSESPTVNSRLRFLEPGTGMPIKPDVAVLCTHGFPGETGELQGLLSISNIPYCSSGVLASALAADKFKCSQYLKSTCGMQIPRQRLLTSEQLSAALPDDSDWQLPFVLKPVSLGSALGVMSVHDRREMPAALARATAHQCDYILQEFIQGLEITAGAVRFRDREIIFPPAPVVRADSSDEAGIRSFTDHKSAQLGSSADIPYEVTSRVSEEMRRIGEALDITGFYRGDFIWSADKLHFLEVNTIPGLGERSVFTHLAEAAGFKLGDLLEALIRTYRRPPGS